MRGACLVLCMGVVGVESSELSHRVATVGYMVWYEKADTAWVDNYNYSVTS
jgi:hypothetical protein